MDIPLFSMSKLESENAFKENFRLIQSTRKLPFIFQLFVILDVYPLYLLLYAKGFVDWPIEYVVWGVCFLSVVFILYHGRYLLILIEYSLLSLMINKFDRLFKKKFKSSEDDFEKLKSVINLLEDIDYGDLEPLVRCSINRNLTTLKQRCIDLTLVANIASLHQQTEEVKAFAQQNVNKRISQLPVVIAKGRTEQKIAQLGEMLERAEQANLYYKNRPFKKHVREYEDHAPQISKHIIQLEAVLTKLTVAYHTLKAFEAEKSQHITAQLDKAEAFASNLLNKRLQLWSTENYSSLVLWDDTIRSGWLAMAMGFSVSAAEDLFKGQQVYSALREVNGNFADLSNAEIWLEALLMSDASLQGLVNLAKGRYFENQVAENTEGQLFENFNHPGTDITIDGMEFQLKATDSEAYINSIDNDILVIATSEVAGKTNAIDSGISNEESTLLVEHALGGSVIDVGDGIINGLGFLGIFATVNGLNHFFKRLDEKVEPCVAADEALEMAFKQTLEGFASVGDLFYGAFHSRPAKLLGRFIFWVFRVK